MIRKLADNIYSPLGTTTEENYTAVKAGFTRLRRYEGGMGLPEPFVASLMDWDQVPSLPGYSRFERIAILSARQALQQAGIDATQAGVLFVIATTKGNVELLEQGDGDDESLLLGIAARRIARYFGNENRPLVVCNACISGLAAQTAALRLLEAGYYETAVVIGADVQSRFIVSGFQSLKALADEECRPFDIERIGLNLGEAAATIVYTAATADRHEELPATAWMAVSGAVRNDAFHISGPSPKGEGSFRAIRAAMGDTPADSLAFVNVHGTSTLYNDEMESAALERAGLNSLPVNSLKGYFGHTMGAAGVLETILSMHAADDATVLGTKGFEELGVSHSVNVSAQNTTTTKHAFLKLLSGFGGCNAAMLFMNGKDGVLSCEGKGKMLDGITVHLTPTYAEVNGRRLPTTSQGAELLTELYRSRINDYPKFFKMDELSRLGFVASELLLQAAGDRHADSEDRAVILFGRSGSLVNDRKYQATISQSDDFFPSPALFVYTLPNIVTGEIAIRNHYYGETSFYVLDEHDERLINQVVSASFLDGTTSSAICGWVDCKSRDQFEAHLRLVSTDHQE